MKKLAILLLLLSSCFPMQIYRVGRHERIIEATGNDLTNGHQLFYHVARRAKLMGCHKTQYLVVMKYYVKAVCIENP